MIINMLLLFSSTAVETLQTFLGLLGKQMKKCVKENFNICKTVIKYLKDKTKSVKPYLITVLAELQPRLDNIADKIEHIGEEFKKLINHFFNKYFYLFTGNFENSSKVVLEFMTEVRKNIEHFKEEAKSCIEHLQSIQELIPIYYSHISWLEEISLKEKIAIFHVEISR
jgi:hypothetical protein